MPTKVPDPNEILLETAATVAKLKDLMAAVNENKVNTVPYANSWTPPQLLRHVTKSVKAMTKAMQMQAETADRDPGERIEFLKNIFLDFSKKLTQPEFIVPEDIIYDKQSSIEELEESFDRFRESVVNANLVELVEGLPIGPVTKWEIAHFVLYHTQRHLHQMKNICKALENS